MPSSWNIRCRGKFKCRLSAVGVLAGLIAALPPLYATELALQFANIHNPYFPDRAPGKGPEKGENFVLAPAPTHFFGIEGDTLPVAFSLVSPVATRVSISVELKTGKDGAGLLTQPAIEIHRVRNVLVEGNGNGNCTCPAGELPRIGGATGMSCVVAVQISDTETPQGCPTVAQRAHIAATRVRAAPFAIKDAVERLVPAPLRVEAESTELFVADIPMSADLPKSTLAIRVTATPEVGPARTVVAPLQIMKLRLDDFPALDLSYWLSEDPRDLVARPEGVGLGATWGGAWWSEVHWRNLERAARLQSKMGVTNVLVPLFVRNSFGVKAKPLVRVRCITGAESVPSGFATPADGEASLFNAALASWDYDFDFDDFDRFVGIFRRAGFRRFEGAHLLSNRGQVPLRLECDLYRTAGETQPYARNFSFMPRTGTVDEDAAQQARRVNIYREKFLPAFAHRLAMELRKVGIEREWYQHVIDENTSSETALATYTGLVAILRQYMPGLQTMDAVNQYSGPRYAGAMDIPVFHLALLYDDQMPRKNIRREINAAFSGSKYFYNTALREGGPNRFLDSNPLEARAQGWLAIELGYQGMLYWAANQYRYPVGADITRFRRTNDWSPFNHTHGPLPGGYVAPGYSPGANWNLYPTESGLIGSIRARRLRDGLIDHWIYTKASTLCRVAKTAGCQQALASIRERLTADSSTISDFSRNPTAYDEARETMLKLFE